MKTRTILGFLVALTALLFVAQIASAFAWYPEIEVNEVHLTEGEYYATFAGDTLDIQVPIAVSENREDVRVVARLLGEPGVYDTTAEFDMIAGATYSVDLSLPLPSDLDELDENLVVQISVETQNEGTDTFNFHLRLQRNNDELQILWVEADSRIEAGNTLTINTVVENIGRDESEDTFVRASIPEFGISRTIFLEDLSADDSHVFGNFDEEDEDDSIEGTILLNIPADIAPGVYNVVIEAFNDETQTSVTRRVEIVEGGAGNSFASSASETFAVGAEGMYSITLVNAGNRIMVYTLVPEADSDLDFNFDETVVAVPAGSSRTVDFTVMSDREGDYDFTVNVLGANGAQIAEQSYSANVEGRSVSTSAAVVLTIILAIIFVVLLVVLIVLLTRKPAKNDELGESYY